MLVLLQAALMKRAAEGADTPSRRGLRTETKWARGEMVEGQVGVVGELQGVLLFWSSAYAATLIGRASAASQREEPSKRDSSRPRRAVGDLRTSLVAETRSSVSGE